MTNFQDVLRDVHDASQHALKTTASLSASTVFIGTPTLHAVVNTSAAGDSTNNIGFATVSVSNPTLYAVVNTSAAGVGNSIVTVANTPLDTQIIGNVTLSGSVPTGANWIGLMTVHTANAQTNTGNVTLNPSPNFIGIATVANKDRNITGNITLSDSRTYVGLTTSTLGRGHQYIGLATVQQVGLVTVVQSNTARTITGNVTLSDSKGFIGLVTVGNNLTIGNAMVTVTLGTKLDSTNDSVDVGTPTVFIGTPTLYAIVNTGAAGVGNSIVTVANTPLDTQIIGNVTLSGPIPTGLNNIGFATVAVSTPTLYAVVNTSAAGVGNSIVTVANTPLDTRILGNVTLSDSKTFVGLVSVSGFTSPLPITDNGGSLTVDGTVTANLGATDNAVLDQIELNTDPLLVVGTGTEATAQRVTIATDSTGVLSVDDNGGSLTVDGSVGVSGNVTLSDAKTYIGLVTATSINGGTNKTLIHKNIELSTSSIATVAVASNTWKATHLLLNSNATARVSIKSGATYLTGNASIGITLNPGGGWVESGSPDSPVYVAPNTAESIVVEKFDMTGTVANVGGKIIYFDE